MCHAYSGSRFGPNSRCYTRSASMPARQPDRDIGEPMNLTYEEAARKLGVTISQLYRMMRNGEIRKLELGPQVRRIPMTELEAWQARKISEQWGETPGAAA